MAELSLILLLLALVGFALYLLRRPELGPAIIWAMAWINAFATLMLVKVGGDPHSAWVAPPAYVLGSLFPALILAGALSYARRTIPTWLLPGALLLGLVRAGLAENEGIAIAQALSLLVEPGLVLAAAWVALGPARGSAPALMPRLLPVAFVMLALVEGAPPSRGSFSRTSPSWSRPAGSSSGPSPWGSRSRRSASGAAPSFAARAMSWSGASRSGPGSFGRAKSASAAWSRCPSKASSSTSEAPSWR